jgi:hypothetical protein
VQKRRERALCFFVPLIADLDELQSRLLLFFQSVLLKHASSATPSLTDDDIAEAASAVAATLETAGRGVIYEHQPPGIPARDAADEIRQALSEVLKAEGRPPRLERDVATVLRRIEQGARTAASALPGDEPPVFLAVLNRLMAQAVSETRTEEPESQPPSIIITG